MKAQYSLIWLLVADLTQKYTKIAALYRFAYPELRLYIKETLKRR